jgi:hypothetical protein
MKSKTIYIYISKSTWVQIQGKTALRKNYLHLWPPVGWKLWGSCPGARILASMHGKCKDQQPCGTDNPVGGSWSLVGPFWSVLDLYCSMGQLHLIASLWKFFDSYASLQSLRESWPGIDGESETVAVSMKYSTISNEIQDLQLLIARLPCNSYLAWYRVVGKGFWVLCPKHTFQLRAVHSKVGLTWCDIFET